MQNKRKMPRHVNMVNVAEHIETDKRSISHIRLSLKEFFGFQNPKPSEPLSNGEKWLWAIIPLCFIGYIVAYVFLVWYRDCGWF